MSGHSQVDSFPCSFASGSDVKTDHGEACFLGSEGTPPLCNKEASMLLLCIEMAVIGDYDLNATWTTNDTIAVIK